METIWQDVRYAVRMLAKNPGFTAIAVLTLALGIGANTAIFSLFDAALLRPLPVAQPDRLVNFLVSFEGGFDPSFNYPLYADYRDRNTVLDGLAAYDSVAMSLTTGGGTERIRGMIVSGNFFQVLGVRPTRGRFFLPEEDRTPETHPVVVLGDGLWRRLGGDASLLGQEIVLNGRKFTVVGIAPRAFTGVMRGIVADFYVPMHMFASVNPGWRGDPLKLRTITWLQMVGRLKPGVAREQAQAAMRTLATQIKAAGTINTDTTLVLTEGRRGFTGLVDNLEDPLRLLQVAVGVVLLIACANVANLLLARAVSRRKEVAVRLALGAGRARLVRQLLTESLLLSLAGGAAGLLVASWLTEFLLRFRPSLTIALDVTTDSRVLAFSFVVTVATGVLFGLAPAWRSTRVELVPALKEARGASGTSRRWNLRSVLVTAQVGLSLALLASAGLCVRSLWRLYSIAAGFDAEKVLVGAVDVGRGGYNEERGRAFYAQLREQLQALPGVEAAGLAEIVPLGGGGMRITSNPEGYVPTDDKLINLSVIPVSPGWFRAMGIPLRKGRDISDHDTASAPRVILVNESLVAKYWPGQDGVGKHIFLSAEPGEQPKSLEVVGVVADSKYRTLTETVPPTMYMPIEQEYGGVAFLFLRTSGDPRALVDPVRKLVRSLDANLPVFSVRTLAEQRANSLATSRLAATLLSGLGTLALLLAAFGLYGVLAYSVAERTHEIGIRMALGAQPGHILRMVAGQWAWLLGIGLGAGVAGALAASKLLGSLLYGVTPHDPLTFAAVAALLALVALVACIVPARRAMRVDPLVALRYE